MKKLLILVALALALTVSLNQSWAEDDWHLRASGGVVFTTDELKDGDFDGTAQFGFMRTVWGSGKVAVGYDYWDMNNGDVQVENHMGKVYAFGRDARSLKFTPYIFSTALFTHGEKFADPSFNGGFGLLVPVAGFVPYIEAGGSKVEGVWYYNVNIGWQIGLKPKKD